MKYFTKYWCQNVKDRRWVKKHMPPEVAILSQCSDLVVREQWDRVRTHQGIFGITGVLLAEIRKILVTVSEDTYFSLNNVNFFYENFGKKSLKLRRLLLVRFLKTSTILTLCTPRHYELPEICVIVTVGYHQFRVILQILCGQHHFFLSFLQVHNSKYTPIN